MDRRTQPHTARLLLFALVVPLIVACAIEGGVAPADGSATATPAGALVLPTSAAVAEQIAAREDTWIIALGERPTSAFPYPATAGDRRVSAPLVELLFPSPVLPFSYNYTTTGVLDRIPSFENGDVEIRDASVYLDAAGNITTTVTEVITDVEQLAVTYHWNEALSWSDGTPVTADDSVFAYEVSREAPQSTEMRELLTQVVTYEKVDDHTTRALLQPDYFGPTYFRTFWTPLPRHLLSGIEPADIPTSDYARSPVGYGPYMLEGLSGDEIRLVRNPYYFGTPPAASRLVLKVLGGIDVMRANLQNGNLDLGVTDRIPVEEFAILDRDASEGRQVLYTLTPVWEHIDFNLDLPVLQDIRIRRAIAHGINRQAMIDAVYAGRVPILESWVLPGNDEAVDPEQLTRYPYNPDEARRLLDETGYVLAEGQTVRASPEGETLNFQLLLPEGSPLRQRVAELFVADMAAIGIDIVLTEVPSSELFSADGPMSFRQFDLVLFGWIADTEPGGLLLWSCGAVPSEGNNWIGDNYAGWCFRDADRAMREADSTPDPAVRRTAYLLQQQLWTQEVPAIPLFQRLSLTYAAGGIVGLQPDPFAPITWNVASWRRQR